MNSKQETKINFSLFLLFFWTLYFTLEYSQLWRRKWQPTPILLPGKSHGRRSLVDYNPWGCKELDTTEWLHSLHALSLEGHGPWGCRESDTTDVTGQGAIANQHCSGSFTWTARGLSYTHTYNHSPSDSPPIQVVLQHWAEFRVLYSRSLLAIHFTYSSVYISIPNSPLSLPPNHPPPPPTATINLYSKSLSLFLFCKFICIISF